MPASRSTLRWWETVGWESSNSGTSSQTQTLPACPRRTSTSWRRIGSPSALAIRAIRAAWSRSTSGSATGSQQRSPAGRLRLGASSSDMRRWYRHASMERVAVLTDVHGNLPALHAALDAMADVDSLYCGGDLVGYGPHPNEVCALIEALGIPTIYGNYDYAIGRDLDDCGCPSVPAADGDPGQRSVEWRLRHPPPASKAFLRGLAFDLRFELGGRRVRLVHGSPRKVNEYLFADKPARTFERIAAGADCEVLVFGHTHQPWVREYGGVLFVNCGSVGKPKDGDPRAAFALLESEGGELGVTIERVEYDALS